MTVQNSTFSLSASKEAALSRVIGSTELLIFKPLIEEILHLKQEKNAVILAHNYMTPEIFHGVADFVGDSLALARKATETDAQVIVQCGVHFMAETSKILNPEKTVIIPDMEAGCSLAESITADDVRALKAQHPGVPVITYVNTSAEVKAESDICCTSGNAKEVIEHLGVDEVIFLPDNYLAANVKAETNVKIIPWRGVCEVHERFSAKDVEDARASNPKLVIIAHPECPREVVEAADYSGSTAKMADFVTKNKPAEVMMLTECSMSDNIAAENPETNFIRPCNMCPHMKRITLEKIRDSLITLSPEVTIDPEIAAKARRAVDRMLEVKV